MSNGIYRLDRPDEYKKAGPTDLLRLLPVNGVHPLYLPKWTVETVVYGIADEGSIHLSGPTGSGKSTLIESLYRVPRNFETVCSALGYPVKPLRVYQAEMVTFETAGELYYRRSLKGGRTYDEESVLLRALRDAARSDVDSYILIWLREIGRVHSSSVQSGLLNLMTKGEVVLPDGTTVCLPHVAWVADSNYQAEHDATHTLVELDDSLKRRFTVHLTLDYLSSESEVQVLKHILTGEDVDEWSLAKIVQLGSAIRRHKAEGQLQSVPPPTIYGYLSFVRMAIRLPHLSLYDVARSTLLGNASREDMKILPGVFNEVFGLSVSEGDDQAIEGGLL